MDVVLLEAQEDQVADNGRAEVQAQQRARAKEGRHVPAEEVQGEAVVESAGSASASALRKCPTSVSTLDSGLYLQ